MLLFVLFMFIPLLEFGGNARGKLPFGARSVELTLNWPVHTYKNRLYKLGHSMYWFHQGQSYFYMYTLPKF